MAGWSNIQKPTFNNPSSQYSQWKISRSDQVPQPQPLDQQVQQTHQGRPQSPSGIKKDIPKGKIVLLIGLPSEFDPNIPQRISVTISDDMDVNELNYHLSKKLGVNGKRWKLIVIGDKKIPYILDKKSDLKKFQTNKKERLYFYPEIRVR